MKRHWTELIIPLAIIIICAVLMGCGIDSEVKAVFTMAATWTFKSVLDKAKEVKKNGGTN